MARWFIGLDERNRNWIWRKVEDDGVISMKSRGSFRYYIDCHFDAQRHGMGRTTQPDVTEKKSAGLQHSR